MANFWLQTRHIGGRTLRTLGAATGVTILFLALSRLTYEVAFPILDWTGRLEIIVPTALVIFVLASYFVPRTRVWWVPLPLLLNIIWLIDPTVNIVRGSILSTASVWLCAVLWLIGRRRRDQLTVSATIGLLILPILGLYLTTISHHVGFADTFEFQVTAPKLGTVHPTGYPLYLLLGKLWTLIPIGTIAWRMNFGTAVYALLAGGFCFALLRDLGRDPDDLIDSSPWVESAAFVGTILLLILPIVWSQAIAAEVYTLHLLFGAVAFWLMGRLLTGRISWDKGSVLLTAWLGLSMTNHVTSVFLIPAAALTIWWMWPKNALLRPAERYGSLVLKSAAIFTAPLLLYSYLPIRHWAVNGDRLGWQGFVDTVTAREFSGNLLLNAPFADTQRYTIVSQLVIDQWPLWLLGIAAFGVVIMFVGRPKFALMLLIVLAGFGYHVLSYYVADLAVFLIPIHLIIAIFCGYGLMSLADGLSELFRASDQPTGSLRFGLLTGLPLLVLIPLLLITVERYPQLDQSADDGREAWAQAVLEQDLAPNSVILADSEKHPPLYYVQQIKNIRPDLDIKILPDEAAYRAELDGAAAAGKTVYLARFLPQLAGSYTLNAAGPLTAVTPKNQFNSSIAPAIFSYEGVDLIDVELKAKSAFHPTMAELHLVWRINETPAESARVFLRWQDGASIFPAGRLPANDYLPFNGVVAGQTIQDFYLLPLTHNDLIGHDETIPLEIALAPPFSPSDQIIWQQVTSVNMTERLNPTSEDFVLERQINITDQWNNPARLTAENLEAFKGLDRLHLPQTLKSGEVPRLPNVFPYLLEATPTENEYHFFTRVQQDIPPLDRPKFLRCGWLQWPSERCFIATVPIRGVFIPEGAINFDDQIAMLDYATSSKVRPGGGIELGVTWQGLRQIDEDYTIFVQVLNQDDQLVGQLDIKPAQGTRPTNLWEPGETVQDKFVIPLSGELSTADSHRLIIGFYRLSDFQRLLVIDSEGAPIGDHFVIPLENE